MNPSLLKAERECRGWSQYELAQRLGVDVSTVARWEQGKAVPYPYYRKKLAALFGKTPRQLGLLPDPDEQGQAPSTPLIAEAATEAFLLTGSTIPQAEDSTEEAYSPTDPTIPWDEDSAERLLIRAELQHDLSPRFLWDGGLSSIRSGSMFRPLNRSSRNLLLIEIILVTVLLIIGEVSAFLKLPLLRGDQRQVSPSSSNTHAQDTFSPPIYPLTIQNTDPTLDDIAQRLQKVFNAVYPQLVNRFALDRASASMQTVTLTFSSDPASAAQTSGRTITLNAHWIEQHPSQIGIFTHALALVVQAYPAGVPAWFADGMADYARSVYGPADDEWSLPNGVQPDESYRQGGPVAARFLVWLQLHTRLDLLDQLHSILQKGQSFSAVFGNLTHETVNHLWSLYQAHPDITPTPQQRYTMATSTRPLFQSSWQLKGSAVYDYAPGLFLSNFAIQADITILTNNNSGGGVFFRNDEKNWYVISLFANDFYRLDGFYQSQHHSGPWIFNSAIKVGLNQTNRLALLVQKQSIYIYINGQFITKIADPHLVSYGTLGVTNAKITDNAMADVRFDHVQIF